VVRGVHLTHAAAADGAEDLVAADARAWRELADERASVAPGRAARRCSHVGGSPGDEVSARAARGDVRLGRLTRMGHQRPAQERHHRALV
jgi:hypothetical protein